MNQYEEYGYYFVKGAVLSLGKFALIMLFLLLAWGFLMQPIDDSDLSRWKRSGLKVHTDNKTGLQYFSTSGGGITPRLTVSGKQMKEGY